MRVGMVFQKPNPFPAMTIRDNVLVRPQAGPDQVPRHATTLVEQSLTRAGLWREVRDRLDRARRRALRRSAAAAVHRPLAGRAAERAADGRAVLGARPDLDPPHRGDDRRAARRWSPSSSSPTTCSRPSGCRTSARSSWPRRTSPGYVVEQGPTDEDVLDARRPAHARLRRGPVRMSRTLGAPCACWPALVAARRRSVAVAASAAGGLTPPASATPARPINGAGSTYVALAMQQWVADAQTQGLKVNYTPTGSPDGPDRVRPGPDRLRRHRGRVRLAAGGRTATRARGLPVRPGRRRRGRGHVQRRRTGAGRKVDYLHLSRRTIARIFMGDIASWNDPAITADNKGLEAAQPADHRRLPRRPVGHDRRCSTTSCSTPIPTSSPVGGQEPAPDQRPHHPARQHARASPAKTLALNGSDQIAAVRRQRPGQVDASATTSSATPRPTARPPPGCRTQSGTWVLPYAAEHLGRARGGHAAPRPEPGPVAACTPAATRSRTRSRRTATSSPSARPPADRPTCKGNYTNPGHQRDLGGVAALHRLRRAGEHGAHRLLAAAAQPVAGDRQLDRPDAGHRARDAATRATAPTPASRGRSAPARPARATRWPRCSRWPAGGGRRRGGATGRLGPRPPAASAPAPRSGKTGAHTKSAGGGSTSSRDAAPGRVHATEPTARRRCRSLRFSRCWRCHPWSASCSPPAQRRWAPRPRHRARRRE